MKAKIKSGSTSNTILYRPYHIIPHQSISSLSAKQTEFRGIKRTTIKIWLITTSSRYSKKRFKSAKLLSTLKILTNMFKR